MRRLWLALVLLMVAAPGAADLASLVADRVEIGDDGTITAEGNVTVIFEGVRMTAERVIYDQDTERLELQGPLTIIDGEDTQILASAAEIDPALRDGLMRSARLVLDQQLHLTKGIALNLGIKAAKAREHTATKRHIIGNLWSAQIATFGQSINKPRKRFVIGGIDGRAFANLRAPHGAFVHQRRKIGGGDNLKVERLLRVGGDEPLGEPGKVVRRCRYMDLPTLLAGCASDMKPRVLRVRREARLPEDLRNLRGPLSRRVLNPEHQRQRASWPKLLSWPSRSTKLVV